MADSKSTSSTKRSKAQECLDIRYTLHHPGGYMPISGMIHSTYARDYEGKAWLVSPKHLYVPSEGVDLYPTTDMLERLRTGERVEFFVSQWA